MFPRVCYVDSVKGFGAAMQSYDLIAWLEAHKEYAEPAGVSAIETDYDRIPPALFAEFGLMISLNAGAISQECKRLLIPGAHLLANDGHYDAARAQVDGDYTLVAVLGPDGAVETREEDLREYFVTKQGQPLTREMLADNERARAKQGAAQDGPHSGRFPVPVQMSERARGSGLAGR